jgi:cellulose synthase/poly-beta-1,6-N-acetylglucosamine synthase-like glycosyltransferase
MKVAVQVVAYDEPDEKLSRTFESVNRQQVPRRLHVEKEAWITPAHPDDSAFSVAREHGFDAYEAGHGKLTARNQAHNSAFDRECDAIVTLDADAPMLSKHTLRNLVTPIRDGKAGAVNSYAVSHKTPEGSFSPFGLVLDVLGRLEDVAFPHLHGQCSAVSERAWRNCGPFETDIDQTDSVEVRQVEEFGFYQCVEENSGVMMRLNAPVYNDPRRQLTSLGLPPREAYSEKIGNKTFGDEY